MFRGKKVCQSETPWTEGYFIEIDGKSYIYNWTFHEVIPETVGEYIGYPDRNVKKIHEGDIHENKGNYFVVLLGWFVDAATNKKKYGWHIKNKHNKCFPLDGTEANSINIVGNIFDNADLLK